MLAAVASWLLHRLIDRVVAHGDLAPERLAESTGGRVLAEAVGVANARHVSARDDGRPAEEHLTFVVVMITV